MKQTSLCSTACCFLCFPFFCFICKKEKPKVDMYENGTMVTVVQHCNACGMKSFKWRSQPYVFGRYPAGNLLLSIATLMAGASIGKIILIFKHMGQAVYTSRILLASKQVYMSNHLDSLGVLSNKIS